ncbi:MAG: GAF domain-containing sensor histidine kinase, partial [Candidatus Xenobia bacterium]
EGDRPRIAGSHNLPADFLECLRERYRSEYVTSFFARAMQTRQVVVKRAVREELLQSPEMAPAYAYLRGAPWETIVIVPMYYRDIGLGALNCYFGPCRGRDDEELSFLQVIADQAAVLVQNARLIDEVRDKALLQERQRLARELHDSVSQALYGIALGARTARTLADRNPAAVKEPLDYVLSLAEAGLAEMRSLIFELRPESLDSEGLVAALERHLGALQARHRIEVASQLAAEPPLSSEGRHALYRVAQEALNNIVKHAAASHVDLTLSADHRNVTLTIADDGQGFDGPGDVPGHLGLRSMRERMATVGGSLQIDSTPGQGTRVLAILPTSTS